jgi:hypothetical protein
MPYLIWSYEYRHASAGPKALHRLCHELNEVGERAYVAHTPTNPEWNTPTHGSSFDGEWIAVYPEVVSGNPWGAPRVARWVLNVPGKLGGDAVYDAIERVFSWDPAFLDDVPFLWAPTLETDIYSDCGEARNGALYFVGRAPKTQELPDAVEITQAMRDDRYALADVLNRAEVLYSFEPQTGMVGLAQLCGCPVVVVPTGQRYEPDGFRAAYEAKRLTFRDQLRDFIRITQA